jgi:hypothetical protein
MRGAQAATPAPTGKSLRVCGTNCIGSKYRVGHGCHRHLSGGQSPPLCLMFDMRLVEVVTDAGLRGYSEAKTQVSIASNHHALVTPITAELQSLLLLGSYQAGHGRPARIPHWLLSSLLNCGNARRAIVHSARGPHHRGNRPAPCLPEASHRLCGRWCTCSHSGSE